MSSRTNNLQKVIKKYYPNQIVQGETPEATAARIIEELQKFKMNTPAEILKMNKDFAHKMLEYCYPNSTGVPDEVKMLANEFFVEWERKAFFEEANQN